jgi:hypothetical protein
MAEARVSDVLEAKVCGMSAAGRSCVGDRRSGRCGRGARADAAAPDRDPLPACLSRRRRSLAGAQYDGFKACFGGEELKRACATLSGALVNTGGKAQVRAGRGPSPPSAAGPPACGPCGGGRR